MRNKILLFIAFAIGVALVGFLNGKEKTIEVNKKETIIAVCPTFYFLSDKLSQDSKLRLIRTGSTSESLYLLFNKKADAIISGRMLKPNELNLEYNIIGEGFSILGQKEQAILYDEMNNYKYYTDQKKEAILEKFPNLGEANIIETSQVYDFVEEGIIITSLENTDYSKSEIVHIFIKQGERYRYSRTPAIYYSFYLEGDKRKELEKTIGKIFFEEISMHNASR